MREPRGLETLGGIYLVTSGILAVAFLVAALSGSGNALLLVGAAAGAVFQGLLVYSVLGWMSDIGEDLAVVRRELRTLRQAVVGDTSTSASRAVSGQGASGGDRMGEGPRVVSKWGVRHCSVCMRNLPAGEHESCPHCGARFETVA